MLNQRYPDRSPDATAATTARARVAFRRQWVVHGCVGRRIVSPRTPFLATLASVLATRT
jgi:hypothetical protein